MKVKTNVPDIRSNYSEELLHYYGVENIEDYLVPLADAIQHPSYLENIGRGYDLFKTVCDRNGKILLIVDCDVDGFTSSAIFYQYTKRLYPDIQIDYRLHEGKQHGLEDHIDWIIEHPIYDLIVCPDSSSNDFEYHEELKIYGIPVLVLDHHLTDVDISENATVINNQLSRDYKNKELTGAGVVYQFCKFLDQQYGTNYAPDYLDLAALGIDGDMGSLLNIENRAILKWGFSDIQNLFFKVLVDKQSFSMGGKVTPISVAFYIVPLINAMIRVGTMAEKDRLFQAFIDGEKMVPSNKRGAKGTMEMVATESARECTNARSHQNKFKEDMVSRLEQKIENEHLLDNKILFIRLEDDMDFPSELNGLVCMQLSAKYKRPTIVARLNKEGYDKGSIRGLNNSELTSFKDLLMDSGLCEYVQGHDNAAGVSILDSNLRQLHEYANEALKDINFNENWYEAQFVRDASDLDIIDIVKDVVEHQDVWGTGVPEPMIYVRGIRVRPSDIQVMGKNQDTLKIVYGGMTYMKFHAKDMIEDLKQFSEMNGRENYLTLEVIGKGNLNEWCGTITPQCIIESWEIKNNDILQF